MPAQSAVTRPAAGAPAAAEPLPPVDSLTFDSDFAAFMQPKVDEGTKRAALKKLFSNEHFNVMDGLDIYVGDYTQPDPMPEGMLDKLANVYEAIKPFDNAPAATDAAALPPVAEDAQAADCRTATQACRARRRAEGRGRTGAAGCRRRGRSAAGCAGRSDDDVGVPVPSGPPKSA